MNLRYAFSAFFLFLLSTLSFSIERPIVLVITSYNNADWYQKNLDSAFSQSYENFRIIYVDDCSPDGTGDLVQQYVEQNGWQDRVTLVKNQVRKMKMENFYRAVNDFCLDEEIVIDFDGDDWLAHENVLSRINEAYEDSNVWMTYGSYVAWPEPIPGGCELIPEEVHKKGSYRQYKWVASQLRTFYGWLFKKIKKEDLLYDGVFLDRTADLGYMFPMMEMSGGRIEYIEDVLYIYNRATPINDNKVAVERQIFLASYLRSLPSYKKLHFSPLVLENQLNCVQKPMVLVITSYNNADWYEKNLDMVFAQNYSSFRVIYVDDCSTDGTGELVAQYIKEKGLEDKILLIRNKIRMFKMYNLVHVIHNFCKDDEIVLDHDGDDWFDHENALSIINAAYEDPDVWLTYGDWIRFPSLEKSNCEKVPNEVVENSSYRNYKWVTSAQRTFYAWLFKRIRIPDLMYGKGFVKADIDTAYMFPMLEMSAGRFKYIKDIIYVYNKLCINTHDEMKFRQQEESKFNRRRKRYKKLESASG